MKSTKWKILLIEIILLNLGQADTGTRNKNRSVDKKKISSSSLFTTNLLIIRLSNSMANNNYNLIRNSQFYCVSCENWKGVFIVVNQSNHRLRMVINNKHFGEMNCHLYWKWLISVQHKTVKCYCFGTIERSLHWSSGNDFKCSLIIRIRFSFCSQHLSIFLHSWHAKY